MQRLQLPRTLSSPAQKTNSASGSRYKSRLTISPWDTGHYQPFVIHETRLAYLAHSQRTNLQVLLSNENCDKSVEDLVKIQKLTLDRALVCQVVFEQILTLSALE